MNLVSGLFIVTLALASLISCGSQNPYKNRDNGGIYKEKEGSVYREGQNNSNRDGNTYRNGGFLNSEDSSENSQEGNKREIKRSNYKKTPSAIKAKK